MVSLSLINKIILTGAVIYLPMILERREEEEMNGNRVWSTALLTQFIYKYNTHTLILLSFVTV